MMIYIYDILLNFCDCDMLYDFYEWNNSDDIENVKRIKLIHIDKGVFNDFLFYDFIVDKELLLKIYRTCEVYSTKKVRIVDYSLLVSDGDRVMALQFDKNGNCIYKSKLLLDEEDEIALLASELEITNIFYERGSKVLENRFFTRNEVIIKKYLVKEIEECYKDKNYDKLKYLYEEYYSDDSNSYKEMYNKLLDSIKCNIDDKHVNLFNLLKLANKKKQV